MNKENPIIPSKYQSFKKALVMAKDYFINSDDRLAAWLFFGGALLAVIALVALTSAFSWWTVGFWAALTAKNLTLFMTSMKTFALLITAYVAVNALKNYFMESLGIRWRYWLTTKLINKYIPDEHSDNNNYLDLARSSKELDTPEQRIQQDVITFVDSAIKLSFSFLKSTLSLVTFVGTLWVVGGALSLVVFGASITIPGYLVWSSLAIALLASAIAQKIGGSLTTYNQNAKQLDAGLRKNIEVISHNAESIAQEHGASYYKKLLLGKLNDIYINARNRLFTKTQLVAFQSFYRQISSIIPYLIASPLYFSGAIELGQLMQVGFSFGEVNHSLSWFVNSYETQAVFEASASRIIELERAFEADGLVASTNKGITATKHDVANDIRVSNLTITKPSSPECIMSGLTMQFKKGEHTLIKGPSGLGKSTLFKALAGAWGHGSGNIYIPSNSRVCFLPQKPCLPTDSLKAVLAYPDSVNTYTDEQYQKALRDVRGMEKFINQLDECDTWSTRMSPGEQQRISFARALLQNPDWLFLDEATASLDPENEQKAYTLIKKQMPKTTIISIAHRPTLDVFHSRIVHFKPKAGEQGLELVEQGGINLTV